jgi:nucleolar protein 15
MSKLIAEAHTTRKRLRSQEGAAAAKNAENKSEVIYVGHLPLLFREKELRTFFGQFGDVDKLKLFKSKKTGNSKGYAFLKFASVQVAMTVSDAINGYHVDDRQLVSHVIPRSSTHKGMFLPYKKEPVEETAEVDHDSEKAVNRRKVKLQKKAEMLRAQGIDFDVHLQTPVAEAATSATPKAAKGKVSKTPAKSPAPPTKKMKK